MPIYLSSFCISNYLTFSKHIYFLSIFLSLLGILVCQRLMITWKDIKLGIFQPWRPNLKTRSSWWSMEQQVCFFVTFDCCVLRVALLIVALLTVALFIVAVLTVALLIVAVWELRFWQLSIYWCTFYSGVLEVALFKVAFLHSVTDIFLEVSIQLFWLFYLFYFWQLCSYIFVSCDIVVTLL